MPAYCPNCGEEMHSEDTYSEPTAEHITYKCIPCGVRWFYKEDDDTCSYTRRLEADPSCTSR